MDITYEFLCIRMSSLSLWINRTDVFTTIGLNLHRPIMLLWWHYISCMKIHIVSKPDTRTIVWSGGLCTSRSLMEGICPAVCSSADERKHQSSAPLSFVRGIDRWPVNPPSKGASNAEYVCIWWRRHSTHFKMNFIDKKIVNTIMTRSRHRFR